MTLLLALLLSTAVGAAVDTAALREEARNLTLAGRWTDALKALDAAKARVPPTETATLAFVATERGRVLADSNFFHEDAPGPARAALEEAQKLAKQAGDELVLSEARMQLARLDYAASFETKDWKKPRTAFESVLAVREKLGDERGVSETLFYLGLTYEQDGQPDAAYERYAKSLAIAEKEKNIILESYVRRHMAGIQEERGELEAARRNIDLEVELRRKGGFLVGVPFALRHKADFVAAHGPGKPEAVKLLEEAAAAAEKCGSTRGLYLVQTDLSRLALESGDVAKALGYAEQAVATAKRFGAPSAVREAEKHLAAAQRGTPAAQSSR
jgi:tetratricopeptide (TPR) repeat protein